MCEAKLFWCCFQIPLFGPLFDGAVVDFASLPGLVREMAVNAGSTIRTLKPYYQTLYPLSVTDVIVVNRHTDFVTLIVWKWFSGVQLVLQKNNYRRSTSVTELLNGLEWASLSDRRKDATSPVLSPLLLELMFINFPSSLAPSTIGILLRPRSALNFPH